MLNELRFVQGAVGKKDLIPALTHFRIENNTIRSFNGTLALCSPIPCDLQCTPKAIPFVKAIQLCKETISLNLTKNGRLSVRSGSFSSFIDCVPEEVETPHVLPEGEEYVVNGAALLEAFRIMLPLIGDDASRPWSNGLLLRGQSAFATNNVIAVEYWVGTEFPSESNIPRECIVEMLRIKEAPLRMQIVPGICITFHYDGGRWIRASLLATNWPEMGKLLNKQTNPKPIPSEFYEALVNLEPFSDKLGRVYIYSDNLSTGLEEGEGANYKLPGLGFEGVYQISMLKLMQSVATSADMSFYPSPCHFYGDRLRGVIIGLRV